MLLMFMLTNFKVIFTCAKWRRPSFLFFCQGIRSVMISKFNCSSKKKKKTKKQKQKKNKQKKTKNWKNWKSLILEKSRYSLYFLKFHIEILWWKSIHCEPTSHNCHTELFRTAPLHNPQSALQFVQYQEPFPDSNFNSSLSPNLAHDVWKRFSQPTHSTTLSDALQYFLQRRHWNLGAGFISTPQAGMRRLIKLIPFEGLKLRNPSELLRFPSFLVYIKHWDIPLVKFL